MAINGLIPQTQMPSSIFNQGAGNIAELMQRAREMALKQQQLQQQGTPEQQQYRALQAKLQEKQALNQQDQMKEAQTSLPLVEQTEAAARRMLEIAETDDPKNSMFGHYLNPYWAEQRKDETFGEWQTNLLPLLNAAEKQLGGNRFTNLTLKTALGAKPSHREQKESAVGKLKSIIEKAQNDRKTLQKILGMPDQQQNANQAAIDQDSGAQKLNMKGANPNEVVIISPDGVHYATTPENAKYLPAGWKRG